MGMKLSDVRREFRIGADRADHRATASDGRTVIIECQLDRSDNGHFGQIMAYASGVDADVLVWIAADFRDKHREAFDWINMKTGPACEFYAVKVGIGKGCEGCTGQPQLHLVAHPRAYRELIDPKDLASCALDDEDLAVVTLLYQRSKVEEDASKFDWSLSKAKRRASAIYAKHGVNTKADALVVALRMGIGENLVPHSDLTPFSSTWNCRIALRRRRDAIDGLRCSVLAIRECAEVDLESDGDYRFKSLTSVVCGH